MTLGHSGQRWTVGSATITSIVEDETHHIPPELFFPDATAAEVAQHPWLVPDYADEPGSEMPPRAVDAPHLNSHLREHPGDSVTAPS